MNAIQIIINARNNAGKALGEAGKQGKSLTKTLKDLRGPLLAVAGGLTAMGTFAIRAASDLDEARNKARVTFGAFSSIVEDFARTSSAQFGISARAANEYAGTLGTILNASGLAQEATAGMSVELIKLAVDLASFNNIAIDEALNKLRAGLVGETEPLRTVGVLLSEAAVQAKAAELGLGAMNGELTEGEKVMARYALIMERTARQQGDFKRTSGSLANQTRILQAQFEDVRATLGQELLPAAIAVIGGLNRVIGVLKDLPAATRQAIVVISAVAGGLAALGLIIPPVVTGVKALAAAFTLARLSMLRFIIIGAVAVKLFDDLDRGLRSASAALGSIFGDDLERSQTLLERTVQSTGDWIGRLDGLAVSASVANEDVSELKATTTDYLDSALRQIPGTTGEWAASIDQVTNALGRANPALERSSSLTERFNKMIPPHIGLQSEWQKMLDESTMRLREQKKALEEVGKAAVSASGPMAALALRDADAASRVVAKSSSPVGLPTFGLDSVRDFAEATGRTLEEAKAHLRDRLPAGIQGFAGGGIVPGPIGAPRLAVVHGGEEVRTPVQQHGENHFHFHGPVFADDIERIVGQAMRNIQRRGGGA